MVKQIKTSLIKTFVHEAYEKVKDISRGANADYIPYLQNISTSFIGISVCLPYAQLFESLGVHIFNGHAYELMFD